MSFAPVPGVQGRAPEARGARRHRRRQNIHEFTKMSVTRAIEFLDQLELSETEQLIGARIIKEIRERLTFLDNVGVGYLQLDRAAGDALRRRGAAPSARDADRLPARRRALHPRRALDRTPPARQREADRDARAAARPRQHRPRRRARRADDARGRLARGHGPGGGRARRARRRRRPGRRGRAQPEVSHRQVPLRRAHDRLPGTTGGGLRLVLGARRDASTTSRTSTSSSPSGSSSASPACPGRASRPSSTRSSTRRSRTGCTGCASSPASTSAARGSSASTRSSTSTSRRSAGRRARTRRPTRSSSTTSASCTP